MFEVGGPSARRIASRLTCVFTLALISGVLVGGVSRAEFEELPGGCAGYNQDGGTGGDDILTGEANARDDLSGWGGNDELHGLGCGDWLGGGENIDMARGYRGNDDIRLGNGHDGGSNPGGIPGGGLGGDGDDLIYGGSGNDWLYDGSDGQPLDVDRLYGEADGDLIHVLDGDNSDTASGGDGTRDECIADRRAETSFCEVVTAAL